MAHDPNNPPVAPAASTYKRPAVDPLETHAPHVDERPEQHEHTDVKIKPLAWTFVALCVLGIVGHGGLFWLHWGYQRAQDAENSKEQKSLVQTGGQRAPASGVPRIQGVPEYNPLTPVQEMNKWRDAETERLNKGEPGALAIDEAIQRALEQGVYKEQPQQQQPTDRPQTRPAESPAGPPPPFEIPKPEQPEGQPSKDVTRVDEAPPPTLDNVRPREGADDGR